MTSLFVNGTVANYNYMEGCFHFYSPPTQAWPGLLLSTGMEDYYDRYWPYFQSVLSVYYKDPGWFTHKETTSSIDLLTLRPLPPPPPR